MKKTLLILFYFAVTISEAQIVPNGSFDGVAGTKHFPPNSWNVCNTTSTPDIMPGCWGVSLAPSEGDSYLNLVVKENGVMEEVNCLLTETLDTSQCYKFSVDLNRSLDFKFEFFGDDYDFTRLANVRFILGENECSLDVDTILEVDDSLNYYKEWVTFSFIFKPTQENVNYLKIETYIDDNVSPFFGHVLVDNISITPSGVQTLSNDSTVHFNGDILEDIGVQYDSNYVYYWDTDRVSCVDCSLSDYTVSERDSFCLYAETQNACFSEVYCFNVNLYPRIPNVITPNNDGVNDFFLIDYLSDNSELIIYNRWGKKVYYSANYTVPWDADGLSSGVYYFVLNFGVKGTDARFHEKGTVTVFK